MSDADSIKNIMDEVDIVHLQLLGILVCGFIIYHASFSICKRLPGGISADITVLSGVRSPYILNSI